MFIGNVLGLFYNRGWTNRISTDTTDTLKNMVIDRQKMIHQLLFVYCFPQTRKKVMLKSNPKSS